MSFPLNLFPNKYIDQEFFAVVERLKNEGILPHQSFVNGVPFFNFSDISITSHIKELFFNACDLDLYKSLLRNITPASEARSFESLSQRLSALGVMNFAQLVLFKVLPCPDAHCPQCPREIATHNQYKDEEYECPFYHHEKDRRRLVITTNTEEEFVYKANYFEEGRRQRNGDKDRYSQNYFESMYHPLYYKMFKCKRDFCNISAFCPFFHSHDEKGIWDEIFSDFVKKDRVSYVKDKQKYYEQATGELKPEVEAYFDRINRKKEKNRKHVVPMYHESGEKIDRSSKPYVGKKWEEGSKGLNRTWNVKTEDVYCGFYGNSKSNKDMMGQEVC